MDGRYTPGSSRSLEDGQPPVVPPIITNERDRVFLVNLQKHIDHELNKVNSDDIEQKYTVYKSAFNEVIDYSTAYKSLLSTIKAEYEDFIDAIKRGERETAFLTGKLQQMVHQPSTIENYRKREEDLQKNIDIIREDNEKLRTQLEQVRQQREEEARRQEEERIRNLPEKQEKPFRVIPGLSVEDAINVNVLNSELDKVSKQLRDLNSSVKTRYVKKEHKEELKEQLRLKVNKRDELQESTEILKAKRHKLKIAVEAAKAYVQQQPLNQTIGEAVVQALNRAATSLQEKDEPTGTSRGTPHPSFEDQDDPHKEREGEVILEYIEKFNELIDDGKYEEAAIHAANSPSGILRNPETLARFKGLSHAHTASGRSPLLAYCDAVMSTVLAYGVRPSAYISREAVIAAMAEYRTDLISHWITNNRLTLSLDIGDMVASACACSKTAACICGVSALAERVYSQLGADLQVVQAMVRQGRVVQAIDFARSLGDLESEDYIQLLREYPTLQLARLLYKPEGAAPSLLPVGAILQVGPHTCDVTSLSDVILQTLFAVDRFDVALPLLKEIYQAGSQHEVTSELSAIRRAVFEDDRTSPEQWLDIVQKCQENGFHEVSLELLAAILVRDSVLSATANVGRLHGDAAADSPINRLMSQLSERLTPRMRTATESDIFRPEDDDVTRRQQPRIKSPEDDVTDEPDPLEVLSRWRENTADSSQLSQGSQSGKKGRRRASVVTSEDGRSVTSRGSERRRSSAAGGGRRRRESSADSMSSTDSVKAGEGRQGRRESSVGRQHRRRQSSVGSEGSGGSVDGRRESGKGRRVSIGGRRESTGGRRESVGGRRESTQSRRESTGGRRESTGGRRESTGGRRESMGGRKRSVAGSSLDSGTTRQDSQQSRQSTSSVESAQASSRSSNGTLRDGSGSRRDSDSRRDSSGPRRDSSGPRRDSSGPRRDSSGPRRDSSGPRRDSSGPRRDSSGPRRDSSGPRRDSSGPRRDSGVTDMGVNSKIHRRRQTVDNNVIEEEPGEDSN